jgi:hypothetical protein
LSGPHVGVADAAPTALHILARETVKKARFTSAFHSLLRLTMIH